MRNKAQTKEKVSEEAFNQVDIVKRNVTQGKHQERNSAIQSKTQIVARCSVFNLVIKYRILKEDPEKQTKKITNEAFGAYWRRAASVIK